MPAIRQLVYGTVESGAVTEPIRIELPDMHLWLYPEPTLIEGVPGVEFVQAQPAARAVVRVETELKSTPEMFGPQADYGSPLPRPCDCETCKAAAKFADTLSSMVPHTVTPTGRS